MRRVVLGADEDAGFGGDADDLDQRATDVQARRDVAVVFLFDEEADVADRVGFVQDLGDAG